MTGKELLEKFETDYKMSSIQAMHAATAMNCHHMHCDACGGKYTKESIDGGRCLNFDNNPCWGMIIPFTEEQWMIKYAIAFGIILRW